jgi:ferredoxin
MRIDKISAILCFVPLLACEEPPAPTGSPSAKPAVASSAPKASATAAASASAAPSAEAASPTLPKHMEQHFTRAVAIRDAIIAGDLEATKKDAQWMAEHELTTEFPETWKPHVTKFQDASKRVLDATTIEDAAVAAAGMAESCGACHVALRAGPKLTMPAAPEGSGAGIHMQRHQWAAARMWDALTTPSEEAWIKGSEMMADAPLEPEAASGAKSVDKSVPELAKKVHDIAEKARQDREMEKWVSGYGQFLQTCATCHKAVGLGPKPPQ